MHAMHWLEQSDKISEEHYAIVPSSSAMISKEITTLQARAIRPLDPYKDMAAYGYGSVAWKNRMEIWKQRQGELGMLRKENNDNEDLDKVVYDDDTEFPL